MRGIDLIDLHIGGFIGLQFEPKRLKAGVLFSTDGFAEIKEFHARMMEDFALAVAAVTANDTDLAERVMRNQDKLVELEKEYRTAHLERLRRGLPESLDTSAVHLDVLTNIERINTHITHMAYTILEGRA